MTAPAPAAPAELSPEPQRRFNEWAARRRTAPDATIRRLSRGGIAAVSVLGVLLLGIIGVAFRGSWTAHRDAALAAHFDNVGADLYPFAPDGLIVIALIAAMVLRHDRSARAYALSIVGLYTLSSYMINQWHGLGWFTPAKPSGPPPTLDWPVVGLIAAQLIGAIFLGSHLLVYVLRHLFPGAGLDQAGQPSQGDAAQPLALVPGTADAPAPEPDPEDVARKVYGVLLDLGHSVGRDKLAAVCGVSQRASVRIRKAVEAERDEAELSQEEAAESKAAAVLLKELEPPTDKPVPYAVNGSGAPGTEVS